ncbi:hypothetical protein C7N43_06010 [Sphingobacteriales bacterium UPWRP_1]|nr:hypothetical protein BVG80_05780 [Sphingobacteriales bacterium TSM_CSM]PSJ78010.1 hypothetical protein C7N43_06010 [Sphingobacteriales bacterium UPWRP_1]
MKPIHCATFYLLCLFMPGFLLKAQVVVDPTLAPFYHGVASGDPLQESVIIWTRISDASGTVPVNWQMATDTAFTNIVNCGTFFTDAGRDYTVKVDVDRLQPNTYYYYRFFANGKYSIRGRTRTLPAGNITNARLAVVACARITDGFYNVYGRIADRNDINAVVHLGDYIYEYGSDPTYITYGVNDHLPPYECVSLSDYRTRYAQYHTEINLRRLHQQHPMIAVWDDHETANNSWYGGAENHDPATEGDWFVRKAAGIQAWLEWLPVRENMTATGQIYRKFSFGNLADLIMLDTRLEGRDIQPSATGNLNDPARHMISDTQMNWLTNALTNSAAQWKLLGQQIMMAPLKVFGVVLNPDQWDGYAYQRSQIYNHIINNNIQNMVVLTGDLHSSWANDLPMSGYNASSGANSAGVEFVISGVTSAGIPFSVGETLIRLLNSHIKWDDVDRHGYMLINITTTRTQCEWYFVPSVLNANTDQTLAATWYVNAGERHLREGSGSSPSPITNVPQAPPTPQPAVTANIKLMLQGAFNNATGQMRTDLLSGYYLPNAQPFNFAPPLHAGNESLTPLPPNAVDWVVVELRQPGTFALVDSVAAVLLSDGTLAGAAWGGCQSPLLFKNAIAGQNYHILVKARNHVGVMSTTPVTLPNPTPYDFTTAAAQAYGNGQQTEVLPGVFALYAGDNNNDGVINYADFNVYTNGLNTPTGYNYGDCNFDGNINLTDFDLWQPNAGQIGVLWVR